jgi:putative transposase
MDNHLHIVIQPKTGLGLARVADNLKTWISRRNSAKPAGSRLWERRYDDNAIQSQREMHQVLDYLHNNPVRAHLVERASEYPWSSIHNYLGGGKALIEVDTGWQG